MANKLPLRLSGGAPKVDQKWIVVLGVAWFSPGPEDGRPAMYRCCLLGGQRIDDASGAPPSSKSGPSHRFGFRKVTTSKNVIHVCVKDEINVPIAPSAFRDKGSRLWSFKKKKTQKKLS